MIHTSCLVDEDIFVRLACGRGRSGVWWQVFRLAFAIGEGCRCRETGRKEKKEIVIFCDEFKLNCAHTLGPGSANQEFKEQKGCCFAFYKRSGVKKAGSRRIAELCTSRLSSPAEVAQVKLRDRPGARVHGFLGESVSDKKRTLQ